MARLFGLIGADGAIDYVDDASNTANLFLARNDKLGHEFGFCSAESLGLRYEAAGRFFPANGALSRVGLQPTHSEPFPPLHQCALTAPG